MRLTPHPGVHPPRLEATGVKISFSLDKPNFKILLFQELLEKKKGRCMYLKELKIPFK